MIPIPPPARKSNFSATKLAVAVAVCMLSFGSFASFAENRTTSSKPGGTDKSSSDKIKVVSDKASSYDKSSAAKGSLGTPKMGWKLTMKVTYFGRVEWAVSEDGGRLTSPMLSLVCRPPDYATKVYNTETHKMMSFSRKAGFDRIGMMMEGALANRKRFQWSEWKKVGSDVIAGRKCDKYVRHLLNADKNETGYTSLDDEYWMAPFFDLKNMDELMAPLEKITNRDFKSAKGFGMRRIATWKVFRKGNPTPLKVEPMVHLDTIDCKRAIIDPKMFDLGKGYVEVKDEGEIMFSDEGGSPMGLPSGFSGGF